MRAKQPVHVIRSRVLLLAVLACGGGFNRLGLIDGARADEKTGRPPSVEADFEDRPQKLTPRRPRDETDQDRVTAATWYAHGRLLLHRDDYAGALRCYQRAWRYDPASVSILSDLVPVAAELKRNDEAARYAALETEAEPSDLPLLMRLAAFLSERRDWTRSARLYERIAELQASGTPDFTTVLIQMELGRLYFLVDKPREAAQAFARVRDALANPDKFGLTKQFQDLILEQPDRTYELFAESFLQAKRFDEALAMFRKAEDIKRKPGLWGYQVARVEFERGQFDAARKALTTYLDENLTDAGVDPYELLARVILEANPDPKAARKEIGERLQELHDRFPANDSLLFVLADQYRVAGDDERAEAAFQTLVRRQPTFDAWKGLRDVLRRQAKWDPLLHTLTDAARAESGEQIAELVTPLAADKGTVEALLERARREAAKKGESRPGTAYVAALLAVAAERFDDAEAFFECAVGDGTPPAPQVFQSWALQMFAADQPARAAKVLRRTIDERVRPESDAIWHYFLAGALEMQGETDAALAAGAKSLEGGGDNPQFEIRLAWILYHAKRYEAAEQAYRRLIEKFDAAAPTPAVRAAAREARLVLSNMAVLTGGTPQAVEWLEQVLDEFPEDVSAMNDLGYLWADQGQHLLRALAMCRQAVAAEPDNRAYRDSLGWALYRLNRSEEALAELEQAVGGTDPDGVLFDHLGDVQWSLGRRDAAQMSWAQACEAFRRDNEPAKLAVTEKKRQSPPP